MPGLTIINGVLPVMSYKDMAENARRQAEEENSQPVIQNLASYVKQCFAVARRAKEEKVEPRLLKALRQRNGEYDPDVLAEIRKMGGSEIYMMLTSNKCRAAASWVRDILLGTRQDRPWTLQPTRVPELSPDMMPLLVQEAAMEAAELERVLGPGMVDARLMREISAKVKDKALARLREEAIMRAERMADLMEDQQQEGGLHLALSEFIEDLVTFPFAMIKGPIVRNQPMLSWVQTTDGNYELIAENKLTLNWERVDPFMIYWQPDAADVNDGYLIERHKLSRTALEAMIGVPGYSEEAIRTVLDEYGRGGLDNWLSIDRDKAEAENKSVMSIQSDVERPIEALQFWGSVSGKLLLEWGMSEEEITDPAHEYQCEVWVIGNWVIKAVVNDDPLGRKPYYKASYEYIPGSWLGNGIPDLIEDCQNMCNAAARALHNNMLLSSGPQVWVNVDRLPPGEDITALYPWRIWQGRSDPYGTNSQPPFGFFQPASHAAELMAIYEKFAVLADEYSNIPRYMTGGVERSFGALRTSSGLSMLMSNAGKSIKNVITNIDSYIITPLLERQYFYNMLYSDNPDLKGDVRIIARGANSIVVKEQNQVRVNEFFNIVSASPVVIDIIGKEKFVELLREVAKQLDINVDRIVPSPEEIRARTIAEQQLAMVMQQNALAATNGATGQFNQGRNIENADQGMRIMPNNGQNLTNGVPITDNFAPMRRP